MQTYDHFADFPCNSAEFSQSDKKVPPFNRKGQGLISEYYFPSSRHTKGFLNLVFVATRYQIFQHPGSPWSVLGQHVFFLVLGKFPGRLRLSRKAWSFWICKNQWFLVLAGERHTWPQKNDPSWRLRLPVDLSEIWRQQTADMVLIKY